MQYFIYSVLVCLLLLPIFYMSVRFASYAILKSFKQIIEETKQNED